MTAEKRVAVNAEPDLVDRIFDYLQSEEPDLAAVDPQRLERLKLMVRSEFRGEMCYIAGMPATARQQKVARILALFNGRNSTEVARKLGVSRATVYRAIKQPALPCSGGNEWTDYDDAAE